MDAEAEVLAKIAEFPPDDRDLAERVHKVVKEAAPELTPRLWYGQPAYSKDGKVLVFFQPASKFKTRYATLGFSDVAALDEGSMWPTYYALAAMRTPRRSRSRSWWRGPPRDARRTRGGRSRGARQVHLGG